MNIAIIDAELIFARSFRQLVENNLSDTIQLLNIFTTAEDFITSKQSYDVIFLDIELPGMSGLELAKNYKSNSTSFVFVTNRDDLVFEAYNTTSTLGFIRKSNVEEDLTCVLFRLKRQSQNNMSLTVKIGSSVRKVKYSEILYIEKVSHNVVLYTLTDTVTIRKTITEIENLLIGNGFARTHIGYIVNITHIKSIDTQDVKLSNGKSVPISRQHVKSVKNKFLKWSENDS